MKKRGFFLGLLLVISILFIGEAEALGANFTLNAPSNLFIERAAATEINISIGAESKNITQVQIEWDSIPGMEEIFIVDTNQSTYQDINFTNRTETGALKKTILTFTNTTRGGIIRNGTTQDFVFQIMGKNMIFSGQSLLSITVNTTSIDDETVTNATDIQLGYAFSFSGWIKNETRDNVTDVNISIYEEVAAPNQPPSLTFLTSTLSAGNDGFFTLSGINASGNNYKLKIVKYNTSNSLIADKVGPTLPAFPQTMYYPFEMPGMGVMSKAFTPPNINGSTFSIQPATTVNITAINTTGAISNFGYVMMDQSSGFMIESKALGSETQYDVIVPTGREYTVMIFRQPTIFAEIPGGVCNGQVFNSTNCPMPPKNNATLGTTNAVMGSSIPVQFNLTIENRQMWGCIGVEGNQTEIDNITTIYPKLLPFAGFVAPMKADTGDIDLTSVTQLSYNDTRCPGDVGFYNITLLNNLYMVEFYGSNDTVNSNGDILGAFYNISLITEPTDYTNITLKPMLGQWYEPGLGDINTSKMKINILNATGSLYSTFTGTIEIVTKRAQNGKTRFLLEETSSTIYFPLINDTEWAEAEIFGNGPPVTKKFNLTAKEVNITIEDGDGFGFRKMNESGQFEDMNVSETPIQMRFLSNSDECNVVNPPDSCVITKMTAEEFNPFAIMTAGKVNMEMKITSTNVTLTYINFDLFSSKPPTNSIFDETAESSGATDLWKFGSFTPKDVYDEVIVTMPYDESSIDETSDINLSIPYLYDEDMNVVWNQSRGDTQTNLTYHYTEKSTNYNSSGFRDYLGAGGVACNSTNNNISDFYCHINSSSNTIYLRLPHFSTVAPQVTGTAVTTSDSTSTDTNTGSSSTGASSTDTSDEEEKETTEKTTITYGTQTANEIIQKVSGKLKAKMQELGVDLAEENLNRMAQKSQQVSAQTSVTRDIDITESASVLNLKIKYNGQDTVNKFMVYDIIPKTFAQNINDITVETQGGVMTVIEEDPEILVIYETLSPGEEKTISYLVNEQVEETILNQAMKPTFFVSNAETASDDIIDTTAPTAGEQEEESSDILLRISAIVVLIFIVIGFVLFFKQR